MIKSIKERTKLLFLLFVLLCMQMKYTVLSLPARTKRVLQTSNGEGYIDTGVKITIAIVIGALLLAGLYALFGTTIMPTLTQKVKDLFGYSGT